MTPEEVVEKEVGFIISIHGNGWIHYPDNSMPADREHTALWQAAGGKQ